MSFKPLQTRQHLEPDDSSSLWSFDALAASVDLEARRFSRLVIDNRDDALPDKDFVAAYNRARDRRIILGWEYRALLRGHPLRPRLLGFQLRVDAIWWRLRNFALSAFTAVPLILGGVVWFNPVPWIPASCLDTSDTQQTIYIISESPPVYLTSDRIMARVDSWEPGSVSLGECES